MRARFRQLYAGTGVTHYVEWANGHETAALAALREAHPEWFREVYVAPNRPCASTPCGFREALSRKRKALFGAITTVAVLLVLELGLRALGVPEEKALLDSGLQFPPPDAWGTIFERDPARHWRLAPSNDRPWGYFRTAYTHERGADVDVNARLAAYPDRDYYRSVSWQVNARGWRGPLPQAAPDGDVPRARPQAGPLPRQLLHLRLGRARRGRLRRPRRRCSA